MISRRPIEQVDDMNIIIFTDGKMWNEENFIARELHAGLPEPLGPCQLFLDFRNIVFMNSSELGTLFSLRKKLNAVGGRLTLVNINSHLGEVFERTHLIEFLEVGNERPARANVLTR